MIIAMAVIVMITILCESIFMMGMVVITVVPTAEAVVMTVPAAAVATMARTIVNSEMQLVTGIARKYAKTLHNPSPSP